MKKRKIIVSLLCASAALGLASCGEEKTPVVPNPETPTVIPTPETPIVTGYKASLVYNNGAENGELNAVQDGDSWYFDRPTNPSKEYNAFTGWYTDAECTQPFNFDNPVTADLTLYAGWEQGYDTVNTIWDFANDAATIVANPNGNVSITEDTQFGKFFIASGARFEISSDASKNCVNTQGKKVTFELTGSGTNNAFTINYKWASSSDGTLQIINVATQEVVFDTTCKNGDAAVTENISNLPAGVYEIVGSKSIRIYALSLSEKLPQGPTFGIEVNTSAATTDFLLGRDFSSEGLGVNLVYENGRKDSIALDDTRVTIVTEDLTSSGVKKVTVSYQQDAQTTYTATYDITIWEAKSLNLYDYVLNNSRVTLNAQTVYAAAADFKSDNIVIKALCTAKGVEGEKEFLLTSSEYTIGTPQADCVTFTYKTLVVDFEFVVVNIPDLSAATAVTVNVNPDVAVSVADGVYTFNTINQALQFLELAKVADNCVKTISLKEGAKFFEKVEINMPNVLLTTAISGDATIAKYATIEFDGYNGLLDPSEKITHSTDGSASISIRESAEGFKAQYVTFVNSYNTYEKYNELKSVTTGTQGVAVLVQADKSVFLDCKFSGYQDTLYAQINRQYYENCYIEGHTDFIFGYDATAYFKNSTIYSIGAGADQNNGGYIVATKGNTKGLKFGYIFDDCTFTADDNTMNGSISLARGWDTGMTMMVMNSSIDEHYSTEAYGYATPDNPDTEDVEKNLNDRYGKMNAEPVAAQLLEYNNTGAGAISASIDKTCTVVDATVYEKFDSLREVFTGDNGATKYADNWAGTFASDVAVKLVYGDTVITTVNEYAGNTLKKSLCNAPDIDKKKFVAWYSDAALTTEYDFDSVLVAGELSLYAKYEDVNYTNYSLVIPSATSYSAETQLDEEGYFFATNGTKTEGIKIAGASYEADGLVFEGTQFSLTSGKIQVADGAIKNGLKVVAPNGKSSIITIYAAQKSDKSTNLMITNEKAEAIEVDNLKQDGVAISEFGILPTTSVTKYTFNSNGGTYYIGGAGGGAYIYGIVLSVESPKTGATVVTENYTTTTLTHGTDYKNQTLFDGEVVTLVTSAGSIKGDSTADYNSGAVQLKLDKDIDGETFKDKALLLTAKMDCTVVLSVCSSGTAKAWTLTCDGVEVNNGAVDKNSGALSTITLTLEAGKTYRFSAPAGGLRFEALSAEGSKEEAKQEVKENYTTTTLTHGTDYKNQTLFDGEVVTLVTSAGSIKGDSTADYNSGAVQLKLDKDIDGETFKDKALLLTAKMDCTVVLSVCSSGTAKAWTLTLDGTEVDSGAVDKNSGALSTITLTLEAGKTYRFSAPAGGLRFEALEATSK